jgi:GDPmannose 4,6-dehydratase
MLVRQLGSWREYSMSETAMKTAMVTGCTGQDGHYMAQLLLVKGYRVVGCLRRGQGASANRAPLDSRVELSEFDMSDQEGMAALLDRYRPDELYNFAAHSSGSGMYDDPVDIGNVNGLAVARILEVIRTKAPNVRFCQASSSEMFGLAEESPQSETTAFNPRSPYGAAKLYAHSMIGIYRRRYGVFGCSAILFNHESPLRTTSFVTRKITREAVRIKLGLASQLRLGNLDARRDWGFAGDYVLAMWKMLQVPAADDYVVATGGTHSVREFCEIAFGHLGLNYAHHVVQDQSHVRPPEAVQLVGNPRKAQRHLDWQPTVTFEQLVCTMVDADLNELKDGARC